MLKKKIWPDFQRVIGLFTQKIVSKLSKIWVWDPGSEIRDPGSGKNLFRIPDPQHWLEVRIRILPSSSKNSKKILYF